MTETGPRWLDADEHAAWLSLMAVVTWLPAALDAQLQRDAGISNFEYGVLAQLSVSPDRTLRLSDLASRSNSTLPRLSKVVDRFEKHGWATRRPCPSDGRYTLGTLTDAGWQKVVEAAPAHVQEVRRLVFDRMTAGQVRQLRAITGKLATSVRPDRSGAWPAL
jgi:DNA-binding MarR family transcriptional regulator